MTGLDPAKLDGLVIDDTAAKKKGNWTSGTGLKGFVGHGYLYSTDSNASIRFKFEAPSTGKQEIRLAWLPHENRGKHVRVTVVAGEESKSLKVDMTRPAPLKNNFFSLGTFDLKKGTACHVEVKAGDAGGHAHVDAVQIVPAK